MNTSVSFSIAKLLKEKGFEYQYQWNPDTDNLPTISEVVMWLYEKHGIWIGVDLTDNTKQFYFQPTIWITKDREYDDFEMLDQAKYICKWKEWEFNSPIEAYQTAIEYTLNNLIK